MLIAAIYSDLKYNAAHWLNYWPGFRYWCYISNKYNLV